MNINRKVILSLLALLGLAFPAAASAHVEINPARAPAGKAVNLALHIGHGCDGAATTSLVVRLPDTVKDVSAKPTDGWKPKLGPQRLTWSGGPLPDHDEQALPFTATLYGAKGDRAVFKTIQRCEGGAETAWIATSGGATEADNPAPTVTLVSNAPAPAPDSRSGDDRIADQGAAATGEPTATAADSEDYASGDDGSGGKSLLLIIVAGLAIGTIAGIIVRARRMK